MQTNPRYRSVPDGTGRTRGLRLDAGLVGKRLVASCGHPASPPGDELSLVQARGTPRSRGILSCCARCLLIGTARCRAGTPGGVRGEEAQASPLSRLKDSLHHRFDHYRAIGDTGVVALEVNGAGLGNVGPERAAGAAQSRLIVDDLLSV